MTRRFLHYTIPLNLFTGIMMLRSQAETPNWGQLLLALFVFAMIPVALCQAEQCRQQENKTFRPGSFTARNQLKAGK